MRRTVTIAARSHAADAIERTIARPAERDHLVGRRVGLHVDSAGGRAVHVGALHFFTPFPLFPATSNTLKVPLKPNLSPKLLSFD